MAAQIEMLLPLPQWVIFISIFAVLLDHLLTICNIFCSFAAFGDTLWVLLFFLCAFLLSSFSFFVGFGLAKNFCLQLRGPKEKTFTRNVLWHEGRQSRGRGRGRGDNVLGILAFFGNSFRRVVCVGKTLAM